MMYPDAMYLIRVSYAPGDSGGIDTWRPIQCKQCIVGMSLRIHTVCNQQESIILCIVVQNAHLAPMRYCESDTHAVRRPDGRDNVPFHWRMNHLYVPSCQRKNI